MAHCSGDSHRPRLASGAAAQKMAAERLGEDFARAGPRPVPVSSRVVSLMACSSGRCKPRLNHTPLTDVRRDTSVPVKTGKDKCF